MDTTILESSHQPATTGLYQSTKIFQNGSYVWRHSMLSMNPDADYVVFIADGETNLDTGANKILAMLKGRLFDELLDFQRGDGGVQFNWFHTESPQGFGGVTKLGQALAGEVTPHLIAAAKALAQILVARHQLQNYWLANQGGAAVLAQALLLVEQSKVHLLHHYVFLMNPYVDQNQVFALCTKSRMQPLTLKNKFYFSKSNTLNFNAFCGGMKFGPGAAVLKVQKCELDGGVKWREVLVCGFDFVATALLIFYGLSLLIYCLAHLDSTLVLTVEKIFSQAKGLPLWQVVLWLCCVPISIWALYTSRVWAYIYLLLFVSNFAAIDKQLQPILLSLMATWTGIVLLASGFIRIKKQRRSTPA